MVLGVGAMAQEKEVILERIAEELVEMGYEGEMEGVQEHLGELLRKPLDINRASAEELENLMLLTDFQIASLLEYRNSNGYILSTAELALVNGFYNGIAELLRPFIIFGKEGDNEYFAGRRGKDTLGLWGKSRGEMLLKGWWKKGEEDYVGDDFYTQVKYRYVYDEKLQVGFTLEKDAGERFMCGGIPLGDFSSIHVCVQDIGVGRGITVQKAVLGDYLVRLGQGLVMWRGFNLSGTSTVQGAYKRGSNIVPYTSSDENSFHRGFASAARKRLARGRYADVAVFFSLKDVDARIKGDTFTSLPTDGLHNTASTLETRKTLGEIIYGASIRYSGIKMRMGFNWVGYGYDALNGRRVQDYNRHQIYQGQYGNFSVDAAVLLGRMRVFAELAADYSASMAFITGVVCRKGDWDLSGTFRTYSRSYIAPYAGAYSTISSCSNQTGFSFVAGKSLRHGNQMTVGGDYTYHPWKRYNIGEESHTAKLWLRLERTQGAHPWNIKIYGNWTSYRQQYKLGVKGAWGGEPLPWMKFKVRWEAVSTCFNTFGVAVGPEAILSGARGKMRLVLRCAYYNSADWNNRIYMYEYDLPSSFASSFMYGKGIKYYMLFNFKAGRRMDVHLKADDRLKVKFGLKMRFF